jgi:hypothetical protein
VLGAAPWRRADRRGRGGGRVSTGERAGGFRSSRNASTPR